MKLQSILAVLIIAFGGSTSACAESIKLTQNIQLNEVAAIYTNPQALERFMKTSMTYATDQVLFQEADHWQSPEEFLTRRSGDCEDFALFVEAVMQKQGRQAYVLSLYGNSDYAHTVGVFYEKGGYNVFDEKGITYYKAKSFEQLATLIHPGWTNAALTERSGTRGHALQKFANPQTNAL